LEAKPATSLPFAWMLPINYFNSKWLPVSQKDDEKVDVRSGRTLFSVMLLNRTKLSQLQLHKL
jgi:hypothetical protein